MLDRSLVASSWIILWKLLSNSPLRSLFLSMKFYKASYSITLISMAYIICCDFKLFLLYLYRTSRWRCLLSDSMLGWRLIELTGVSFAFYFLAKFLQWFIINIAEFSLSCFAFSLNDLLSLNTLYAIIIKYKRRNYIFIFIQDFNRRTYCEFSTLLIFCSIMLRSFLLNKKPTL